MSVATRWRVFQVTDSAFPTGGFAHSSGLEAAVHFGWARTPSEFDAYVGAHLWNAGNGLLPFVGAAHDDPSAVGRLGKTPVAVMVNVEVNFRLY